MFTVGKRTTDVVRVTIAEAVPATDGQEAQPAAVVVLVPIDPKMRRRAIGAARRYLESIDAEADTGLAGDLLFDVSEEVSKELLRLGIVGIEGIADEETGEPFDLTPDRATRLRTAGEPDRPTGTIDDLLADDRVFAKLDADYVIPDAKRRAEKNASSGAPNGTSTGATPVNGTANSPVTRKRRAAAKAARTARTKSRPTKAKGSGKP